MSNSQKKVLLISNMYPSPKSPSYGTFIKDIENNLINNGWDVKKIVLYKKNSKIIKIWSYLKFFAYTLKNLLFDKDRIVYVHYWTFSGIPLLFIKPKKLIINIHGSDLLPQKKIQKCLLKITKNLLYQSDLIIVPSKFYKDLLTSNFKIRTEKIFVSPSGGIVLPNFFADKAFDSTHPSFGFVGRIEKEKGWQLIFRAIEVLPDDKKVSFTFVGTGSEQKKLKELADSTVKSKKNIEIKILGAVEHEKLNLIYQTFDFLIFPSERESLGLVGLEAMANGVPVIGSAIGGILTYLNDGENGFTFRVKDFKQLSSILSNITNMGIEMYEQLSQNSIDTSQKYEQSAIGQELSSKFCAVNCCKKGEG
ncbi:glycosyltransferase family 4 protein [Lactococcus lactis]|uniref:Glycosyltransferase family 4 protein n=1 Tax=Lactococcus lactis subsp. lactis TaxID=1360 RepID=A0AAJ4JTL5_LACLL|nr:glycosyltransferase family 4 protein [Lactococcus lactis]QRZ33787.1 glycosyltransferase family 4 protein [Lactococcus lactis subsp. lactis]